MPNIKDVARLAGVSITTVSRVINNTSYTSETTKKKVREAMKTLDYYPHQIARALSKKQSFLIGVIIPDSSNIFFAELLKAIEQEAVLKSYKILVCNSRNDKDIESEYIRMLNENRVDGIIMGSHALGLSVYENIKRPVITFDRAIGDIPFVSSDNFSGGQLATQHLIDSGCSRLLHISGPLDLNMLSNRRTDAFKLSCMEAGISYNIIESENDQLTFSYHQAFVKEKVEPHLKEIDGVFCGNDILAYALYIQCVKNGIKVPEELKIVGYDYNQFTQMLYQPLLSTVAQPIQLMGKLLTEGLIGLIEGKAIHSQQLPVTFIKGSTS